METKLINGNAIEELNGIKDESIDLIVTDPPYKITQRGNSGNSGGMFTTKKSMNGDLFNHNNVKIKDYAKEFFRVLKSETHCYVMTNHKNLFEMLDEFQKAGFIFTKSLIWEKDNKIMGQYYMSQFEYILFFRKGKAKKINHCGTSDILYFKNKKLKNKNGKNLHNTEKPVGLMKILIENSTNNGGIVLDPFMGIGASGVACKNLNRNFIGIELDEEYFEIAKRRIENEK